MDGIKFSAPLRENHYALWNWLANNPKKDKWQWPGWDTLRRLRIKTPFALCFLCEAFPGDDCEKCPICPCTACPNEGIFDKWILEIDPRKSAAIARKIRDAWK
jgi:hypothetical protein